VCTKEKLSSQKENQPEKAEMWGQQDKQWPIHELSAKLLDVALLEPCKKIQIWHMLRVHLRASLYSWSHKFAKQPDNLCPLAPTCFWYFLIQISMPTTKLYWN
jgi:hypothetical protein